MVVGDIKLRFWLFFVLRNLRSFPFSLLLKHLTNMPVLMSLKEPCHEPNWAHANWCWNLMLTSALSQSLSAPQWSTTSRVRRSGPAGSCGPRSAPVCRGCELKQLRRTTRSSKTLSSQQHKSEYRSMDNQMGQIAVLLVPNGNPWRTLRST